MGHEPADDLSDSDARSWAGTLLPWLMSGTTHLAILLLLALTWEHASGSGSEKYKMAGASLLVHVVSRSSVDQDGADDGVDLTGGRFFDDERPDQNQPNPIAPVAPASPLAAPAAQGAIGAPGSPLALAMNAGPPTMRGILPATGTGIGAGGLGEGPGGGGVDTAGAMAQPSQSSGRGAKLRGGYTRTGVFGVEGEGAKFVYVFDRSGSMDGHGGLPLAMAKAELISSLKDLGQTHQFQIIFYNEHPRIFNLAGSPGRLVFGNDYNKMQAQKFVGSITADGATQHEEAIMTALRMAPDVIFFLTDADEPRMSPQQLARINKLNPGTQINAIEFGYGPQSDANNFLVQLARQNAGRHVYIDVSRLVGRAG